MPFMVNSSFVYVKAIIMSRQILLILLVITSLTTMGGVFSARTSIELAKKQKSDIISKKGYNNHDETIHAFVTIDNPCSELFLNQIGATVNSRFGNVRGITLPIDCVEKLTTILGIKHIDIEKHYTLCNNKSRELSRFPSMTYSTGDYLSPAYTGKNVVVGVIDVGVDFNHINFIDKDGNNRIVRVYVPCDTTGVSPVVDGLSLPGSEYTTAEQIACLTTDDSTMYHGTHTAGTAAGSYLPNGLHGVATGAQIVVCAMPESELTDFNIASSIKYIFNYADQVGLPAVINMSLSSQDGPHDGSSVLCRLFDELSGPGRICVVSSGNDADMPMNINKTLGVNDSLATFLADWHRREVMSGYSSMWSMSGTRHTVDAVIWDVIADTLIHRLDIPQEAELDSVYVVSSENDTVFAKYFTGELYFACAIEDNGHFHSLVETNYAHSDKNHYKIGLIHKAPEGEKLMGWTSNNIIYSKESLNGWTGGIRNGGCNVSDLATSDQVISVGAYCSSNSFVMMDGSTRTISDSHPEDIAYFSGFGTDARNINRPDLVAPGYMLASSGSRYVESLKSPSKIVDLVSVDGNEYPYALEGGTSMSAPVVAGAIALWLEIEPQLSPDDIRELMAATCYSDSYVENGIAIKWGYGKLDIDAGIKYLQEKQEGDINHDGVVTSADVTALYDILLGASLTNIQRADVNRDNVITSADVTRLYDILLGL